MYRNNKERILVALILFTIIFALFTVIVSSTSESTAKRPGVSARAAALYEPESRTFLYEKCADCRLPMASTTKIMTALCVAEAGDLDRAVRIPREATGVEGSSLYLKAGEILTVRELLYGLMLRSANDAAAALAILTDGSVEAFADRMNEKAESLGLSDTHFDNPHGLDTETHYTSAKDLARLAAAALENEDFAAIVSTEKITIENGDGEVRLLQNHNRLLSSMDGCVGIKTGFTKRSGRCLVTAATRDGLTMVAVTLDAPDDWSDHRALMDYGYSLLEKKILAEVGEYSYDLPIVGGQNATLTVQNTEGLTRVSAPGERYHTEVHLPRYLIAPIQEGDEVGEVLFKNAEGKVVARLPLTATAGDEVAKRSFFDLFKRKNEI